MLQDGPGGGEAGDSNRDEDECRRPGRAPASCPHLLPVRRQRPRQLPALWRRSLRGPDGLATPSPGPVLLMRTFHTDVLACPRGRGTRRVVAVVLRSSTAQAILEHLRLPSRPLLARSGHLPAPARPLVGAVRGSRLAPARPRPWDCSTLRRVSAPPHPSRQPRPAHSGPATRTPCPGLRHESPVCSSLDHGFENLADLRVICWSLVDDAAHVHGTQQYASPRVAPDATRALGWQRMPLG